MNVCGLLSKLKFKEFHDFIQQYEVVALVETKLDAYDTVICNGYKYFCINHKNCKCKSGGIGYLVRDFLYDKIQILDTKNDNCMWFKIANTFEKNIIFGITCIPPEGSSYSSIEIFDDLENVL